MTIRALAGASSSMSFSKPFVKSGRPGERLVGAVGQKGDRGIQRERMLFQVTEAVGGATEAGAGVAEDGVAGPAEVAERHLLVRGPGGQGHLPPTVTLLALDERAAEQDDAVAVLQRERSVGQGQGDQREGEHGGEGLFGGPRYCRRRGGS
jgi:hypothetical protein